MKPKWRLLLPVVLLVALILAGGLYYIDGVQSALWNKAVLDILEVTAQGRLALDTYIEKDKEMLRVLAMELAELKSTDGELLMRALRLSSTAGASYFSADLGSGAVYTDRMENGVLDAAQLETFRALEGRGTRAPFLDGRTGVWTLGCYERFLFADGAQGYVQRSQPLTKVEDRFSLSFYDDSGFSYVVDRQGGILIRSQHPNSNRTFQNLFDIIDLEGNDAGDIASFRDALLNGKRGAWRLHYQGEDYVFCFVPMNSIPGWYVVSIIPDRVIMEQANSIVQHSQVLFLLIAASVLVFIAFFLLYRNSMRRVFLAEERSRKAAQSASIAKSRFLSNMSHDIRTPMNAIIGMTKLAGDHIQEPQKVREYLKKIALSSQLLVGLINDILDMSKIESGKMVLNNDSNSLVKLLHGLVNIVQPNIGQRGQRFNIRLHQVSHETLYFDALRLNQVLINLLSNAIKFTPDGGSIAVDVWEKPSPQAGRAHFTFRVADTGIGMTKEFMDEIFVAFNRAQESRVNQTEGTGLGMAITKMIVDMMGGTIEVESELGKGSVFTVDLDFPLTADSQLPSLPPLRVLAVDDDADTCRSIECFMHELGLVGETATQGRQAVEMVAAASLRGENYDLVLLDWQMPDMGGVEVARSIRARAGRQVPVVILSAYDWARIEEEACQAGVDGFVQKPFFKSTLYNCVRQYALNQDMPEKNAEQDVDLRGKNILVAEDNALNQEIVRELLIGVGARVTLAGNGLECVRLFEQSAAKVFDLILMDVHMPIMDGYEATRRIRGLPRPDAANIPIFAMTADAFAEDVEAAAKAGMNGHLAKPLDIPAMLRAIEKCVQKSHEG